MSFKRDVIERVRATVYKGLKKTVHVDMLHSTHVNFRLACVKRSLSMQVVLEEIAERISRGDPYMMRLLDDLVERKRDRAYASLTEMDAETVYNLIERESPLGSMIPGANTDAE